MASAPTGTIVLTDPRIYFAQWDISADLSKVQMSVTPDPQDDTVLGQTFRTRKPGLLKGKIHAEGYSQFNATATSAIDGRLYTNIGAQDIPISVSAKGCNAGDTAFFMKAMFAKYALGGSVGQMLKFQMDAECSGVDPVLATGFVMVDASASRSNAYSGPGLQLGALSATQKMRVAVHLLAVSGGNFAANSYSAVASDFSGATARGGSAVYTVPGSEVYTISGPITDTWWRWTPNGTFSSATFLVIAGIL